MNTTHHEHGSNARAGAGFTLTDTERACGVTLVDVQSARNYAYIYRGGQPYPAVVLPSFCPPALAGAAARMALGGPVEFSHLSGGMPVYRLA